MSVLNTLNSLNSRQLLAIIPPGIIAPPPVPHYIIPPGPPPPPPGCPPRFCCTNCQRAFCNAQQLSQHKCVLLPTISDRYLPMRYYIQN